MTNHYQSCHNSATPKFTYTLTILHPFGDYLSMIGLLISMSYQIGQPISAASLINRDRLNDEAELVVVFSTDMEDRVNVTAPAVNSADAPDCTRND